MPWLTRADVVATLRKRWGTGEFLTAFASGQPWTPIGVSLRGPKSREVAEEFAAVSDWVRSWRPVTDLRVEDVTVGGRLVGANQVPARAWVDSYDSLWSLLGVRGEVRRFMGLVEHTRSAAPALVDWMVSRPLAVLALDEETWLKVVATVLWIDTRARRDMYVRQIDVPGVDTKFIEANRTVVAALLDLQLAPERIDQTQTSFAARYGFLQKPRYVRYRWLDPTRSTAGFSELTVRVREFAPPEVRTVFVVENDVTYLAFPRVPDAIAIFGGGYAVSQLADLSWSRDRPLVYWGDIDTHGFVMLDRMRAEFPNTRSMLMDRSTLLAHESQWVAEKQPVRTPLPRLTTAEATLYDGLVEGVYGPAVRLEQERVAFSAIEAHLRTMDHVAGGHSDGCDAAEGRS